MSVGGAWGGAEIGASIGVAGGPAGILIGGVIGAFFGGFVSAKISRAAIETQPMSISVNFKSNHKTTNNSYGVSPSISWNNVRNKVGSFILIARSQSIVHWIVKNISRYTTSLAEDC
jgi:hypothetical protein